MSDVSKTNAELIELIAATIRRVDGNHTMGAGELGEHIAAALESATRVPEQGEASDGREASEAEIQKAARVLHIARCCNLASGSLHPGPDSDDVFAAGVVLNAVPRATVPDTASAAIERVRAIHKMLTQLQYPVPNERKPRKLQVCSHCKRPGAGDALHPWPCPTLAALDGTPEPEVTP